MMQFNWKRLWPVALVVAALFAATTLFLPVFGRPIISFVQKTKTVASIDVLAEMRDLLQFNTVQYVYRVVFPYDFMPPEITAETIAAKLRTPLSNLGQRIAAIVKDPHSVLSEAEITYLQAKAVADQVGLRYESPQYQFSVITVVAEAGFDLKGTAFENRTTVKPEEAAKIFRVETIKSGETGPVGGRRAVIKLPPAKVADVRIEDTDASDPKSPAVAFPRIETRPGQWKTIADFIGTYYQKKTVQEGILADARKNAQAFIVGLMSNLDYDDVRVETD